MVRIDNDIRPYREGPTERIVNPDFHPGVVGQILIESGIPDIKVGEHPDRGTVVFCATPRADRVFSGAITAVMKSHSDVYGQGVDPMSMRLRTVSATRDYVSGMRQDNEKR